MSTKPGTFQKGNKLAVGSGGPKKSRPVTSAIIQKLNEVDPTTGREYVWRLVDELFEQALSSTITTGKGKNKIKTRVLGDLSAITAIMDRSDGKPVQGIGIEPGDGKVTIVFEAADKGVL